MISKWVLLLHICTFIGEPVCNSVTIAPYEFDRWSDCVRVGYMQSYKTFMQLEDTDLEQIAIKFECKQLKLSKTTTSHSFS